MKKLLFGLAIILYFSNSALAESYLVASRTGKKYHESFCYHIKNIKPENILPLSSPEEARRYGYKPCEDCRPPTESEK